MKLRMLKFSRRTYDNFNINWAETNRQELFYRQRVQEWDRPSRGRGRRLPATARPPEAWRETRRSRESRRPLEGPKIQSTKEFSSIFN